MQREITEQVWKVKSECLTLSKRLEIMEGTGQNNYKKLEKKCFNAFFRSEKN